MNIALLDSGAGGLSILKEIDNQCLNCNLTYIADLAYFPYGLLDEPTLNARVEYLVDKLLKQHTIDAIIIACNTASTLVLPTLRNRWAIPFIGVVPAIKPAANASKTGKIGILATPATTNRNYLDQLITSFAHGKDVYRYGSNKLVELCETYVSSNNLDTTLLREELNQLLIQDEEIDHIVLACTHFPLLKEQLVQICDNNHQAIQFIDSTKAIIERLLFLLPELKSTESHHQIIRLLSTNNKDIVDYAEFLKTDRTIKLQSNFG